MAPCPAQTTRYSHVQPALPALASLYLLRLEELLMAVDPTICVRIWSVWQAANPGQNPSLSGAVAVMDPWSETEVDTRSPTALGYTYA
jgi:hypothetical protein